MQTLSGNFNGVCFVVFATSTGSRLGKSVPIYEREMGRGMGTGWDWGRGGEGKGEGEGVI